MADQVFLPLRRDGRTLVFTYRAEPAYRRRSFVALAHIGADGPQAIGTRLDTVTRDGCVQAAAWLARNGNAMPGDLVRDGWMDRLHARLAQDPCPGQSPVETLALYLDLAKQRAITAAQLQAHMALADGFGVIGAATILRRLLAEDDRDALDGVLARDLSLAHETAPSGRDGAFFFEQAAIACHRLDRSEARIACLQEACRCHENAASLRRLANALFETGDQAGAIDAYERSQRLKPLPGLAARRLAKLRGD